MELEIFSVSLDFMLVICGQNQGKMTEKCTPPNSHNNKKEQSTQYNDDFRVLIGTADLKGA